MLKLKEKVERNTKIFLKKNEEYKIFTKELLDFLGDSLFVAPATHSTHLYNAFPGGLVDHILKVSKYAIQINSMLPEHIRIDVFSLLKICMIHQIGKVNRFKITNEDYKNIKGVMYDINEQFNKISVGERSVYYSITNGVKLNEIEYSTIINFEKEFTNNVYGIILRQANELAILEEKEEYNYGTGTK